MDSRTRFAASPFDMVTFFSNKEECTIILWTTVDSHSFYSVTVSYMYIYYTAFSFKSHACRDNSRAHPRVSLYRQTVLVSYGA